MGLLSLIAVGTRERLRRFRAKTMIEEAASQRQNLI